MKDCAFCSLVNQTNKELCSKLENKVLYEDDFVDSFHGFADCFFVIFMTDQIFPEQMD
jgi:hypothetical protein